MPLSSSGTLIGVLALYGHADQEITVTERRSIEALLPVLGDAVASSLHRPSVLVDCSDITVRDATMATLDSLLSHPRDGALSSSPVIHLSVTSASADPADPSRIQLLVNDLVRRVSPRGQSNTCVVKLNSSDYFLCSLDGGTSHTLEAEVRAALGDRRFSELIVQTIAIRDSLELQHLARRVFEAPSRRSDRQRPHRVH